MPKDIGSGRDRLPSAFHPFIREADAYHRLGKALERAGITDGSYYAYEAAAELDCQVPELRTSWGGGALQWADRPRAVIAESVRDFKAHSFRRTRHLWESPNQWG